jgi:hypothetical protein
VTDFVGAPHICVPVTQPPHSSNFGGTYACTRISKWPPFLGNKGNDTPLCTAQGWFFTTLFEGLFKESDPFSRETPLCNNRFQETDPFSRENIITLFKYQSFYGFYGSDR